MITYETKNTHPGTLPAATIYMDGLLCLSFDHANKCTVGVNNVAGNGHGWKFSIVSPDSPKPILELNQEQSSKLREIHIDIKGGTTGGAYVYNGNRAVLIPEEQRFNLESSWVDLEGPRGHNTRIENNANTLWPRFYINDGLFCASQLSTDSFELRDSNPKPLVKPLGKIAVAVVADIFLDPHTSSKIKVKLPDRTVSLDNDKWYQIFISNDCDYASVGPGQTDFHLHYKAFSDAFDGSHRGEMKATDKFYLVSNTVSAKGKTESNLAQTRGAYPDPATDKAPCMAIALGRTSAFKA